MVSWAPDQETATDLANLYRSRADLRQGPRQQGTVTRSDGGGRSQMLEVVERHVQRIEQAADPVTVALAKELA